MENRCCRYRFVGLSNAVLLAQHMKSLPWILFKLKVDMINSASHL
jgi:hypothetical protein